ncbi:zinc finger protein 37-like [Entelurus aequoreus]|uniref:zinc finger protein 37-like n=1 Tax=Entelurus aequoreus TaxID=161455 RepID=UPI002B1E54C1|nr:zinc finger protein 37-like [Entelurus aequoreus]
MYLALQNIGFAAPHSKDHVADKKLVNIQKANCPLPERTSAAMPNYLWTAFRAQISTTMDTVLRSAVLEITEIFSKCMREYCMELTAKDEMIALLEMKLQTTQHLLKERMDAGGCDATAAGDTTPKCDDEQEGEDKEALVTSCEMPSEVPAECSLEDVTKDSSTVCPVRLRHFSIPLQPCPLPLGKSKLQSRQRSKNATKKGSLLKKSPKDSEDKHLTKGSLLKKSPKDSDSRHLTKGEQRRHLPGRKHKRLLPDDNKEASLERPVKTACRRSARRLAGEEQQHPAGDKTPGAESGTSLTVEQVTDDKTTELDVKWMAPIEDPEELELSNGPSQGADCNWAPNKVQSKLPWQDMGERCGTGFICLVCRKQVASRLGLIAHFRIHTGEKPVHCHTCPMAFRTSSQLCRHNKRMHPALKGPAS